MNSESSNASLMASEIGQSLSPQGDYSNYQVIRRDGGVVAFNPSKIAVAITKAYIATHGTASLNSSSARVQIGNLTNIVVATLKARKALGGAIHIEEIQDQVELALMRNGEHEVARSYVLYREDRNKQRQAEILSAQDGGSAFTQNNTPRIHVVDKDGNKKPLDVTALEAVVAFACEQLSASVNSKRIIDNVYKNIYDGVSEAEVDKSLILAARQLIEISPDYHFVTARLLLNNIIKEVLDINVSDYAQMQSAYRDYFAKYIEYGVRHELLAEHLQSFDLAMLAEAIIAKRDLQFKYLGLQTLYDRYFIHHAGRRIELPQVFFMRVAMGLAMLEDNKNERAIEFYHLLSSFDFMSSTPTLFNAGTRHSQLSSCYLTTVPDDLAGIYDALKDNALLSKFAGGLGNDWSNVRAMGALIKGTNGKSQGVIPFLKVVNDTAVAVNQGGKRKGAVCAYLETWHLDIEEFLELRKNTGDDRRRCHDMNSANWIPDLFMQRVHEGANWTLFSPSDVPNLHHKYGEDFTKSYTEYEELAQKGEIKLFKTIPALQLWRKMLTMLFETGHPWITFKDPCNIRSPQQHVGVVHSSNLCTEITLNTNDKEIAVCNLGSVNLVNHMNIKRGELDVAKLQRTIKTAMRMLDNVIDSNFYPVAKAENSNFKHRPVGLGIMGFQDCLHLLRIPYASEQAVEFADHSMELVAYYAYLASSDLALERGVYPSYEGSLWHQGILPLDSLNMLKNARNNPEHLQVNTNSKLNWQALKAQISKQGMRNSNCLAIAPTATIANIVGVSASIEPTYQNIFVKSNLSGEFTVVNEYLVHELSLLGLWDEVMLADIKYFDGSLAKIERVPNELKELYKTAFEIDPVWLVEAGSRRQKWIDQSQSLNLYLAQASGRKLDELYRLAWVRGLKTTYYLRTLAATAAEKSTGMGGELNAVQITAASHANNLGNMINMINGDNKSTASSAQAQFCSIDNPDCEACQ